MASEQIKDQTLVSALASTDQFILDDVLNLTYKTTLSQLQAYMQSNLSFSPVSQSTQTGNYTVLDGDGFTHIYLSGASADSTFTLPTLADNQNRVIRLINLDTTYTLTIDGEGAETIDSSTSIALPEQYNFIEIIGASSEWVVQNKRRTYSTGWVNCTDWTNQQLGDTVGGTVGHNLGLSFEKLKTNVAIGPNSDGSGAYQINHIDTGGSVDIGISEINTSNNAITVQTGTDGVRLIVSTAASQRLTTDSWYYNIKITDIG